MSVGSPVSTMATRPLFFLLLLVFATAALTSTITTIHLSEVIEAQHHNTISTAEEHHDDDRLDILMHYVVHFKKGSSPRHKGDLARVLNSTHVAPVPERSFVAFTTLRQLLRLKESHRWEVAWINELEAKHKIHPSFLDTTESDDIEVQATPNPRSREGVRASLVVLVSSPPIISEWEDLLHSRSVEARSITQVSPQKVRVMLRGRGQRRAAAHILAHANEVRWIEPMRTFHPQNQIATWTIQSDRPNERPIWDRGLRGEGEVVQVGDTGIDHDSCFFRDDAHPTPFYPDINRDHRKIISYVQCVDENLQVDSGDLSHAHGTHVAGSVAGSTTGPQGSHNGLAVGSKIFATDLACKEPDLYLPPDLNEYYAPAYASGARVSHNSWGSDDAPRKYEATDRETDIFAYENQDFLIVFAAGNSPYRGVLSPAAAKNALTVGAHLNSKFENQRENVASFSAHGPTWDHRIKPEIMSPGQPVVSAESDGSLSTRQCSVESKYGTSMSAPFVSASALIIRQYFREGWFPYGRKASQKPLEPSSSLLKAIIIHSGTEMTGTQSGTSITGIPNGIQGWGRLRLQHILHFGDEYPAPHMLILNNATIGQDQTVQMCFSFRESATVDRIPGVKVTMVWLDPPPAEGVSKVLMNDIDVVLQGPDGRLLYPTSKGFDRGNNVEQIHFKEASPGSYRVLVYGFRVLEHHPYANGLPFSMVVTAEGIQEETFGEKFGAGSTTPVAKGVSACTMKSCPTFNGAPCGGPSRGQCDTKTGLCICEKNFHHVDCSQCNELTVCNGAGTCNDDLSCTCQETFEGPHCEKCKPGWYGPKCDGDCKCKRGGEANCDKELGRCRCPDSDADGHFTGKDCEFCKRGWRGADCNVASHWCVDKKMVNITGESSGWIQINGGPKYRNSMVCRWHITVPGAKNIKLRFPLFRVEPTYDFVYVYRGGKELPSAKIWNKEGHHSEFAEIVPGDEVLIVFKADLYEPDVGFEMEYVADMGRCGSHGEEVGGLCRCDQGWAGPECQYAVHSRAPRPHTPVPTLWTRTPTELDTPTPNTPVPTTRSPPIPSTPWPSSAHFTPPPPTPIPTQPPHTPAPFSCSVRDEGESLSCNGHGSCMISPEGEACKCEDGWMGSHCLGQCPIPNVKTWLTANEVEEKPCGKGWCVLIDVEDEAVMCACENGYTGVACHLPLEKKWIHVSQGEMLTQHIMLDKGETFLWIKQPAQATFFVNFHVQHDSPIETLALRLWKDIVWAGIPEERVHDILLLPTASGLQGTVQINPSGKDLSYAIELPRIKGGHVLVRIVGAGSIHPSAKAEFDNSPSFIDGLSLHSVNITRAIDQEKQLSANSRKHIDKGTLLTLALGFLVAVAISSAIIFYIWNKRAKKLALKKELEESAAQGAAIERAAAERAASSSAAAEAANGTNAASS